MLNEKRAQANAAKAEAAANEVKRQQEVEKRIAHQQGLVMDVQSQREKPALAGARPPRPARPPHRAGGCGCCPVLPGPRPGPQLRCGSQGETDG